MALTSVMAPKAAVAACEGGNECEEGCGWGGRPTDPDCCEGVQCPCTVDSDCDADRICVADTCVAGTCWDEACPSGYECYAINEDTAFALCTPEDEVDECRDYRGCDEGGGCAASSTPSAATALTAVTALFFGLLLTRPRRRGSSTGG